MQRVTWGPEGYASFGQRLGAVVLDGLIVTGAGLVLLGLLGAVVAITDGNAVAIALLVLGVLVWTVGAYAYEAILVNRRGATIGKKAVGIEVRTADGALPSAGQSWGRVLARGFLSGIFFLGYLWMLWDDRNRTWHDMICGTYVVDRRRVSAATGAAGGPIGGYGAAYQTWGAPPQAWGGQPQAQPQPAWGSQPLPAWGDQPQPEPQSQPHPPEGVAPWAAPAPQPAPGDLPGLEDSAASGPLRPAGAPAETAGPPAAGRPQGEETTGAPQSAPSEPPATQPPTVVGEWAAEPAPATGASAAEPARQATAASAAEEPTAAGQPSPVAAPAGPPAGSDPNVVAVDQAGLAPESVSWLHQVAAQVDPRLDRVNPGWRGSSQAEVARACVFGLLLGRLGALYPHTRADLGRAAEAHPSFSTLPAGNRLSTLERLAADPSQAARWLGPLVDVHDPGRIRALLE